MKRIFFIRHAKSSWDSGVSKDIDRPLNKRGRRDGPRMARLLKEKNFKIDGMIKSPAQRITETADFFIEELGLQKEQVYTEFTIYHGSLYEVLDAMQSLPKEWDNALLLGHNTSMTSVAYHFGARDIENVPTCGILEVESSADDWAEVNDSNAKVKAFYYPKQLDHG